MGKVRWCEGAEEEKDRTKGRGKQGKWDNNGAKEIRMY